MSRLNVYNQEETAKLLDYDALVLALRHATEENDAGLIHAPVRLGVPLSDEGVLLSMPASAADIAVHKLISVSPKNPSRGLPTIFGTVLVCDGTTGEPEFILDGPTLTGRRTAALSMLGVRLLLGSDPQSFLVIGTGQQARFHAEAINQLYPSAALHIRGIDSISEINFCSDMQSKGVLAQPTLGVVPSEVETIITVTTSKTPVYDDRATLHRLVIGVGAFTPDSAEVSKETILDSQVFVDDLKATRAEAGDLIQAKIDWTAVRTLGSAVNGRVPRDQPIFLKTVGSGAWDLAACRVARSAVRQTRA